MNLFPPWFLFFDPETWDGSNLFMPAGQCHAHGPGTGSCVLTTMMTPRFVVAEFSIDPNQFAQAYYHTDAIESVRALTDVSGATVARYDYAPFGEDSQPLTGNPIRFTGQELDSESGHYYYGARYDRNLWGRFATVDPLLNATGAVADSQLWNRYAYVLNNPLVLVDPIGGTDHLIKTRENIAALERILRQQSLSPSDRRLAEYAMQQLKGALR
jgi:RHS repeat-associated protein